MKVDRSPLISDYVAGLSMRDISARHGVPFSTVRDAIHRAGVPRRPRGGRDKPAVDDAAVLAMYHLGLSTRAIGQALGVDKGTVAYRAARYGVRFPRARGRAVVDNSHPVVDNSESAQVT